ncbi:hypothetical protein CMI42_02925 [Candidatus Pacearchaeota archaeon]|nr:hypothetical protein [Candidatus Pacearchaeota archaeon]
MELPEIRMSKVEIGDFLIVRYLPSKVPSGIVATKIIGVYRGGFEYENSSVHVLEDFDNRSIEEMLERGMTVEESLVELPPEFDLPLDTGLVYRVGGVYIPKDNGPILPSISRDDNYQKSLPITVSA